MKCPPRQDDIQNMRTPLNTDIQIRLFQPGQEALVAQVHNVAFAQWVDTLESYYNYKPLTSRDIEGWNKQTTNVIWMAFANDKAVGYASGQIKVISGNQGFLYLSFDITHPDWGQSKIAIAPEYRHQGVATLLLQTILADFKAKGGKLVTAYAYNFNALASSLFAKLEFINQELFFFEPYANQTPFRYDAVYAELDLTKPLRKMRLHPDLIIRKASDKDKPALLNLFRESASFAFGSEPTKAQIETWLSNPDSAAILIGEFQEKLVGVMEYFNNGVIGIPGILPSYRKQGFGTTLFYHLLKNMKDNNFKRAIGDTGIIQKEMIKMYQQFEFDVSKRLLNWSKIL